MQGRPVPAIVSQIAGFKCHVTGVNPYRHRILFCLISFASVWLLAAEATIKNV
jgi:hypothetical protein